MTKDTKYRIDDGPWTVDLWRDRRLAILSGLNRNPVVGDPWVPPIPIFWNRNI